MNETRPVPDEDRLKRLVHELDAVVRRELPWYTGEEQDPGIALVNLLAFVGDCLAYYQARIADEAYLQHQHTFEGSRVTVSIDGLPWREISSFESSGPSDAVYVASVGADGSGTVHFGDGQHGSRPPTGAHVAAMYRNGAGGARAVVTIRWPPEPPLALEVHANSARVSFTERRR